MFTNAFITHASKGLDVELFDCQSVVVYINGEFWGLAQLVEKDDRHHFKNHFGVEEEDLALAAVNGRKLTEVDGGLRKKVLQLQSSDLSDDKKFKEVASYLDISSFIDYTIIETFFMSLSINVIQILSNTIIS